MSLNPLAWLRPSLAGVAAVALAACGEDTSLGPDDRAALAPPPRPRLSAGRTSGPAET